MDHTSNIITTNNKRRPTLPNYSLGYHYGMQVSILSIGTMGLGGKVSATQLVQ